MHELTSTDAELAVRAKAGDEDAFRALVERHLRTAYDFAFRYLGGRDEADDVVQEAFIKAWKALRRYDVTRSFRTWLITIVRNTALDAVKKRREPLISEFDAEDGSNALFDALEDPAPLADELLARKGVREELDTALATLSPDRRMTVILHDRDEMTFEEIAVVMKTPMNTVKSWYRRSLKVLRAFLESRAPKNR